MRKILTIFLLLLISPLIFARGASESSLQQTADDPQLKGGLISAQQAKEMLDKNRDIILIDVRTREEYESGKIPGALLLPYDEITGQTAAQLIPSKNSQIIVYCRSGRRSAIAAQSLKSHGYTIVYDMGGIGSWPYGLE